MIDGTKYYYLKEDLELPPGQYDMDLELVSKRSIYSSSITESLGVYRKEAVYIYSNMVTEAPEYKFTERHFTADLYFYGTTYIYQGQTSGRNYKAVEVQVSFNNEPNAASYPSDSLITIVDAVCPVAENGRWELFIDSHVINQGSGQLDTSAWYNYLYFRFKVTDNTNEVYSPWVYAALDNDIHGRPQLKSGSSIDLSASIYSINSVFTSANADYNGAAVPAGTTITTGYYTAIHGTNPPARTDFAQNTPVLVRVTVPAAYGVIKDRVELLWLLLEQFTL